LAVPVVSGCDSRHNGQMKHYRYRRNHGYAALGGLIIAVITALVTHPQTAEQLASAQPGLWHVTHDVDGDTINVQQGSTRETVRFIGVDTPETHDPRKPVQCFGKTAAAHTKAVLEGKDVRLAPDPEDQDRDKYGRLLRYIYLPDGTLVNAELIKDGYGFAYVVFPFEKLDQFRQLESDARQNNRGLWAGCGVDSSSLIKQTSGSK
jgi:endonuclease YncB( thermonuclease family)